MINSNSPLNNFISHTHWEQAFEEAFALLTMAQPGDVISIVGPSRGGKSSLISSLINSMFSDPHGDQKSLSYLSIVAGNHGTNASFSSKSLLLDLLDALAHPAFSIPKEYMPKEIKEVGFTRAAEHTLKFVLQKALIYYGVKYVFIDEAQHIRYTVNSKTSPEGALDSWKSIAQSAGFVLVVVGTYPLLYTMSESPHFVGRKHQIHLPRYGDSKTDLRGFIKVLKTYESILSDYLIGPVLTKNVLELQKKTLGCIGNLKNVLQGAIALADLRNCKVDYELISARFHSIKDLEKIAKEIEDGESFLSSDVNSEETRNKSTRKETKSKKNKKPFEANPKRRTLNNRERGHS